MSQTRSVQTEDIYSVGSRISWSAILAGAAVAIAFQFLFGILALVINGPAPQRGVEPTTGTIVWMIATALVSLFAGGVVTSLLTAGENKVEAAIYGIVMWATVTAVVAHGASYGLANPSAHTPQAADRWDSAALNAGVPADQVQQWRTKLTEQRSESERGTVEVSSKARWWTFSVIWMSMLAATIGAYVGAGPTFRLVRVVPAGISHENAARN